MLAVCLLLWRHENSNFPVASVWKLLICLRNHTEKFSQTQIWVKFYLAVKHAPYVNVVNSCIAMSSVHGNIFRKTNYHICSHFVLNFDNSKFTILHITQLLLDVWGWRKSRKKNVCVRIQSCISSTYKESQRFRCTASEEKVIKHWSDQWKRAIVKDE